MRSVASAWTAAGLLAAGASFAAALDGPGGDRPALPADTLDEAALLAPGALGLGEAVPGVESTPLALARLALGRRLFFDPILSLDRSVSCASCHDPARAFATNDVRPPGVGGRLCGRNSPPIFNRAWGATHFWDGRAATLEQQVVMPIEHPDEMALPLHEALARLAGDAGYRALFAAAGTSEPDAATLAASLAEFLRRLVVGDSPIDRFRAAQGPLSALERRGLWLYESKGRCWKCHSGPNFSDEQFHNTGVGVRDGAPEPARFAVTGEETDTGAFKTPTLRMVAKTAPYMHDGSLATLEEVVRFYARGGEKNPHLDPKMEPLELDDHDVAALVAFLEALSRDADDPPPGEPAPTDPDTPAASPPATEPDEAPATPAPRPKRKVY